MIDEKNEEHWFASLDGEHYIPINRQPNEEDAETIRALLDGDGKSTRPMTWAPRAIGWLGSVDWFDPEKTEAPTA